MRTGTVEWVCRLSDPFLPICDGGRRRGPPYPVNGVGVAEGWTAAESSGEWRSLDTAVLGLTLKMKSDLRLRQEWLDVWDA